MTLIVSVRCAIAALASISTRAVYLLGLTRARMIALELIGVAIHFLIHPATIVRRRYSDGVSSTAAGSHTVSRVGHFIPRGRTRLAVAS